ncbi:MAG: 4Fe-4S dicluster domain-containing protein [Acidobacteria bacterium]|nr:4Fe-4S dicluster domain-containing protein [Acidobacteriota bacterium]
MTQSSSPLIEVVERRTFLKVLGSAGPAAAIAACSPIAPEKIIPFVIPPEDVIPGVATWYASVCGECPAGCGILVRTREGRAVKVEGNPEHPVNRGGLCVRGQSSLQGLYNPDRIPGPQRRRVTNAANGQSVMEALPWEDAEQNLIDRVQALRDAGRGDRIAVITPPLTGTMATLTATWVEALGGARWVRYEPFAYEAVRESNRRLFGRAQVPHYDFANADCLLSFGADFLETFSSPVGYARDHAGQRRVRDGVKARFVQIEPRLSMTGASADEWHAVAPETEGLVAAAMVHTIVAEQRAQGIAPETLEQIATLVAASSPEAVASTTGLPADTIRGLAREFSDPTRGPGRSLAVGGGVGVSGANATATHSAITLLNLVAGNVGTTVDFGAASTLDASTYADMQALAESMRAGDVELAIVHNVNPVFAMPGEADFAGALAAVPFVVSLSSLPDETTAQADLLLPTHTPLEAWGDSNPRHGVYGLLQPTMQPVFDTRHLGDVMIAVGRALGGETAAKFPRRGGFYGYLRDTWEAMQPVPAAAEATAETAPGNVAPAEAPDFEAYWADALRRGGTTLPVEPVDVELLPAVFETDLTAALAPPGRSRPYALIAYPSLHFFDGRGANRPWLQEIPDPMLKTTWGTGIEMTAETAEALGATEGQMVAVESDHGQVDASVIINPHLGADVVAIAIGQGHTNFGRYADNRGVNPVALLSATPETASGGVRWTGTGVNLTTRELARPIPRLQRTFDQDGRELAQSVSLAALVAGDVHPEEEHFSLHADHEHPDHRWGMSIDLDACNGCNACVAACYAENNIPVMGADAMRRGRTMSWLRIERFDDPAPERDGPDNRFLPMLCQHCDHAPCETVCPVFATYHTEEGLNAQVYNRCVGTRYCSNNCPYKVRRFNWFMPEFDSPMHLQLNPDVTARSTGIMEKCTFCVQRIQHGKETARDEDRPMRDGDVTSACAQSCPAQAIVFGDMNDPGSRVSQLSNDARAYHALAAFNTRPAVTYLKKVTPDV